MTDPTSSKLPAATRRDGESGATEVARFHEARNGLVFTVTHLPGGPSKGGVVICSSIYTDYILNYRREVLLARRLAADGIAVVRFHYWGFGHSDGDPARADFASMQRDAQDAASLLDDALGGARPAWLGTRWGALVAAAASEPGDPLVFWEPALDGRSYFREAFRARKMHEVATGDAGGDLAEELEGQGSVDVLGYVVGRDLYHSVMDRTLAAEVGTTPRPVLYVQLSGTQRLKGRAAEAVAGWEEAGLAVTVELIGGNEVWWFLDARAVRSPRLIATTAAWLEGVLQGVPS